MTYKRFFSMLRQLGYDVKQINRLNMLALENAFDVCEDDVEHMSFEEIDALCALGRNFVIDNLDWIEE